MRNKKLILFLVIGIIAFLGLFVTGCNKSPAGTGVVNPDLTGIPPVISTYPANGDINVPVNQKLSVTFSGTMDTSTITSASYKLTGPGDVAVTGTVSYIGNTATFTPDSNLAYNTLYVSTVTTAVKDMAGKALPDNYTGSFTTGSAPDITPPTAFFTSPAINGINVPVNQKITIIFNEAMDPATLNSATFTVSASGAAVKGTVVSIGKSATFTPDLKLAGKKQYTATIATGAKDLAGNALANNYVWSFTTGAAEDIIAPSAISFNPANGAIDTPVNQKINVIFSEAMDPATITTATFRITKTSGAVALIGRIEYIGNTATFAPNNNLANNTQYTITVTTGAKDLAGNALTTNYVKSFTTGAVADTSSPAVISTNPANGASFSSTGQNISVTFSKEMDPATITTTNFNVIASSGGAIVTGTITYAGNTAIFNPGSDLNSSSQYTVTITTGVKDLAGNALAVNYVWRFNTEGTGGGSTASDTTKPTVISVSPLNNAIGVPVNQKIAVTFSEAMSNTTTFTVTGVPGTFAYAGSTVTFTPNANLAYSTLYTGTITAANAKDLANNTLAVNYTWSFTTGTAPDIIKPTVTSVSPLNGAVNVPINQKISVLFSEAMDISTTFTVTGPGPVTVTGTFAYAGSTVTFTPDSDLTASTVYSVTITAANAKDLALNTMLGDYSWSFTTGVGPDITKPTVVSVAPLDTAVNVPVNQKVSVVFSEGMDTSTQFTVTGAGAVPGTFAYAGSTVTFTPNANLAYSTLYTVTITAANAKDLASPANTLLADYTWSFTTVAAGDITPPTVLSVSPVDTTMNVSIDTKIAATFSEAMANTTQFTVTKPGPVTVAGTWAYAGSTVTFTPNANLDYSTLYTVTITGVGVNGAKDLALNSLAAIYTWSFTTGIAPVSLLTAGNFAVLAGPTVTNTGLLTTINGNLGVSPGAAVTNFPPGIVTGPWAMFKADPTAAQAQLDLTAAYNNAAARTPVPTGTFLNPGAAGDIAGMNLSPGLYKFTGQAKATTSFTLTGSATDVWIFQIASDLIISNSVTVTLGGNAKMENIFWQVGTSATIGTNVVFKGTIMADQSISMDTGATLDGRLLARIAAVTLNGNTVTMP